MRSRKITGSVATAAMSVGVALAAAPGASATPAAPAQTAAAPQALVGDFVGDARDEVLNYVAGGGPDIMGSFARNADGTISLRTTPFTVNGSYRPVVGNFDADAKSEILWYAPGAGADSIWDFTGPTTYSSRPVQVDGSFIPAAGDFDGNGVDDVLWYGVGSAADRLWSFAGNGTWQSSAQSVSGNYRPVVGSFGADGTDDVIWYAVGGLADHLWDFTPGSTAHTSRPLSVNGDYVPVALDMWGDGGRGGDVFWYAPGTTPDSHWDYRQGALTSRPDGVNGRYAPVAAGDLFADGHDDLVFFSYSEASVSIWDHTVSGATLSRTRTRMGLTEISPPVDGQEQSTVVVATR